MTRKGYMGAIDEVNAAYEAEDYERYEELLSMHSKEFGKTEWQFEDDCTDARMFGHDASDFDDDMM